MSFFIPNEESFVAFTPGPVGLMDAPTGVSATKAGGVGILGVDDYSYIVTGVNDTGETLGSTPATATTTEVGGVTVAWSALDGADGYRVYGRVSGSEALLTQVGNVLTWTDSGAVDPGATVPPDLGTASDMTSPSVADIEEAVELTRYVTGCNFSATGNTVPTPNLKSLFEPSIEGTSTATGTLDCYRDDEVDTAWDLLPRRTRGFMLIRRYGGKPGTAGDPLEVWPIRVSSRAAGALTSGQVVNFTVTCAIPAEPAENAVVVA